MRPDEGLDLTAGYRQSVQESTIAQVEVTWMSARAFARLAVPLKLTSTVLVFHANSTCTPLLNSQHAVLVRTSSLV